MGKGRCTGNASPTNSINFRTLCLQDGPLGVRSTSAKADGTDITTSASDTTSQGASAAQNANVAIVFITADSGEEYIFIGKNTGDRNDLEAWHSGADLVKAVVGVKNTIILVNTVGPILKLSRTYRT
jgi:beta-glucosidase